MVADSDNRVEFRDTLQQATADRLSGMLEVGNDKEEIGMVVLVGGEIAWASCIHQPEDLGTFLVRLGHLSRDDLAELRIAYNRAGGRKKLGRLLEEAGLVSRPVLRNCLARHIRMALASMLCREDLVATWRPGHRDVGEELRFSLREVLPEWEIPPQGVQLPPIHQIPDGTAGFAEIASIPGYRGAVIASANGTVLARHSPDMVMIGEPTLLGTITFNMLENLNRSSTLPNMGRLEAVYLDGPGGSIVTRWIDPEHHFLVALLFFAGAKVGSARQRLSSSLPDLLGYVTEHAAAAVGAGK